MKFTDVFERNSNTGAMKIEVALDKYNDFYHEWDNARNRIRDIHPELYSFIEECSDLIPLRNRLEINFNIACEHRNTQLEDEIRASFHNLYSLNHLVQKKQLLSVVRSIIMSAVFGIAFLWISFFFGGRLFSENLFLEIALEGFTIGGWVFIWEAIYISAFRFRAEVEIIKKIKRFLSTKLIFNYSGDTNEI